MPHRLDIHRPLPLYDLAATRRLEAHAAAQLPPHTLMQRAGLAVARLSLALAPHARTVWIACGPGNNGGDGLEAAMHLRQWGSRPLVTWLGEENRLPDDARASLARARAAGVAFVDTPPELGPQDLCIDALLGIGATRAPEGRMGELLAHLRAAPSIQLAVDVPSGLNADTGSLATNKSAPEPPAGGPRHTLSLLSCKPGLFTAQGCDACGSLWFDDLGVSPQTEAPSAWLNTPPALTPRRHDSHKGRFGDVAIIGGEHEAAQGIAMAGAALLAGRAALGGGAGRVYVSPLGSGIWLDPVAPELMFRPVGALDLAALTVVCGCGGGQAVRAVLPQVLEQAPRLVLDADALNALAENEALARALRARAAPGQATVLTPHPLEAARLLACSAGEVQAHRLRAAQALANRFQCVAVLKGSGTVIAAPGRPPCINPTGNPRLATAGTGDVLAGLVGARLAAGLPAWEAARHAVWQHGAVADEWPEGQAFSAGALAQALQP